MSPNDAEGMANSVDPDQTAPVGAVWFGSALFAQTYPSENLGSLRYVLSTSCNIKYKNLVEWIGLTVLVKILLGHKCGDMVKFAIMI